MNSQDSDYPYGYCEEGKRFHALKSGKRQGRVSMIAAWCHQQLLAPFSFEGCCNRTVFELWLEFILIPTLKPGQTLVLDNATFHKGGRIAELVGWRQLSSMPFTLSTTLFARPQQDREMLVVAESPYSPLH
ncbi:transposase (fragment) [Limnospira indica PCC 8005]|uniref:Transposase n=1 Tax=Limnospira indica PCC 8005 TaxID=376219 RepID=A0A9P1KBC5_9CYAN